MSKKLSIASTVLATVVMASALVYYNFIDKKKVVEKQKYCVEVDGSVEV